MQSTVYLISIKLYTDTMCFVFGKDFDTSEMLCEFRTVGNSVENILYISAPVICKALAR